MLTLWRIFPLYHLQPSFVLLLPSKDHTRSSVQIAGQSVGTCPCYIITLETERAHKGQEMEHVDSINSLPSCYPSNLNIGEHFLIEGSLPYTYWRLTSLVSFHIVRIYLTEENQKQIKRKKKPTGLPFLKNLSTVVKYICCMNITHLGSSMLRKSKQTPKKIERKNLWDM